MTVGNFALLHHIRDELGSSSSTKLVTNIDFDVSAWGETWQYPTLLEKALRQADMVFHVESVGANVLSHVLDREVRTIPHPVDVDGLDAYKTDDRDPAIVTIYHRYRQDITTQYWALRGLPLTKVLLGYSRGTVPSLSMYDEDIGQLKFIDAIGVMSRSMFALDLFSGHTYGRAVCELAALCVPCVCSDTIEASRQLFPELCVSPYDVKGANALFKRLISDAEFNDTVWRHAYYAAGYYSQKESYARMVEALEQGA
jgi:glycosyltransferase involved in cell wall biosynthesis